MPLALSVGPAPRAGPPSTSPRAGGHLPQTAHPPGPSRRWRCASGRWQAALRHGAAVFAPLAGPPRSGAFKVCVPVYFNFRLRLSQVGAQPDSGRLPLPANGTEGACQAGPGVLL